MSSKCAGYSEDGDQRRSRVRRLLDQDSDGRYDTSTVYAEGLSWPTAITCYRDGVFVGDGPRSATTGTPTATDWWTGEQAVWTGFHRENVQGLLNNLQWGLDQRIHGATSSNGADLCPADAPEQPALLLRGRDFAWKPWDR